MAANSHRTSARGPVRRPTTYDPWRRPFGALAAVAVTLGLWLVPARLLAGESAAPTPAADPGHAAERVAENDLAAVPAAVAGREADAVGAPAPAVQTPAKRKPHPMAADMLAAIERERASLAELARRFRAAPTPEAALAVQREIASRPITRAARGSSRPPR
jgi:hypothetical protein